MDFVAVVARLLRRRLAAAMPCLPLGHACSIANV
jgi:hypothetical protein